MAEDLPKRALSFWKVVTHQHKGCLQAAFMLMRRGWDYVGLLPSTPTGPSLKRRSNRLSCRFVEPGDLFLTVPPYHKRPRKAAFYDMAERVSVTLFL